MKQITTVGGLKEYVWSRLPPMRRHLAGQDKVNDLVDVIIIEWPQDILMSCRSGDTEEVLCMRALNKSVKRHMAMAYGETYGFALITIWILWQVMWIILAWWHFNSENKEVLCGWRSKYYLDKEET